MGYTLCCGSHGDFDQSSPTFIDVVFRPLLEVIDDEGDRDPTGEGLRRAAAHGRRGRPRSHKVLALPVRAEGVRWVPWEGHPQHAQENQERVLLCRAAFCHRLLDLRLGREGARATAEEAARTVRPRDVRVMRET